MMMSIKGFIKQVQGEISSLNSLERLIGKEGKTISLVGDSENPGEVSIGLRIFKAVSKDVAAIPEDTVVLVVGAEEDFLLVKSAFIPLPEIVNSKPVIASAPLAAG